MLRGTWKVGQEEDELRVSAEMLCVVSAETGGQRTGDYQHILQAGARSYSAPPAWL